MLSQLPSALLLLLCSAASTAASSVTTFSDADCQKSQTRIAGDNGYPDGYCTNVAGRANADFQSFMFTALDEGCTPTVYLKDTTSDICSGENELAYISKCYNTTWVFFSIDGCTPLTSATQSTSSATASSSSAAAATSSRVSDGAIAGAVVGSVCGLGIIAAVSAYFFWFRPKQRERKKREIEESGFRGAAGGVSAGAGRKEEEDDKGYLINMHESRQNPHELQSMPHVFEAPGDNRANEMGNDGEVPVELPADHHQYGGKWEQSPRR